MSASVLFLFLALASDPKMDELRVLPPPKSATAPDMVTSYLNNLAIEALQRRRATYEALKTPEQIVDYQKRLREFFVRQLDGFPAKTPLNAQTTGKEAASDYRLEKVMFESRPNHHVTAILYLPMSEPPYPGVIIPCGHSDNGKAAETYQRASILLAKNGIAALCYDPIGQGERYQALGDNGKPRFGTTTEHTLMGVGSILVGTNTAQYRIYDGMRAIDYLQSRPEIDPKRIGVTGNSGGGTLSSYLMALDERIVCAAPSCYLTTFQRLLETIGPQDAEQNIYGQIAFGMDHPDYILMRAPKPTLMCVATRDFFDITGAWDNYRQAKRIYTRLGLSERVDLVETDATHGFSTQLRVGAVRWMRRWLLDKHVPIVEEDFPIWKDEQLRCSPKGQVMLMPNERSVFDLNTEKDKDLAQQRATYWEKTPKAEAIAAARKLAGVRPRDQLPPVKSRSVGFVDREGVRIEKLVLETEPGIGLPALGFIPATPRGEAILYLSGDGKQTDAAAGGAIEQLVRQGHVVLAVDLRGMGETEPAGAIKGFSEHFGPEWRQYYIAYLLERSMVGMRAEDILCAAQFLRGYHKPEGDRGIHLIASGEAGVPALHAAAFEPELFQKASFIHTLATWSDVVRTPVAKNQLVNTIHGVLKLYDLPDLAKSLGDKATFGSGTNASGAEFQ